MIAEVYPSLWRRGFPLEGRTPDQHDVFCIAVWLARADLDGSLGVYLRPDLILPERAAAQVEGWILGVRNSQPLSLAKRSPAATRRHSMSALRR